MNISGKPLEHLFIDLVPIPAVMRGIPECKDKNFLFICDPLSKFVDKINVGDKTAEETIKGLEQWRQRMLHQGFNLFIYLLTIIFFVNGNFKNSLSCNQEEATSLANFRIFSIY